MYYIELTLNNWDKHGLEPITVTDPQEIRRRLDLKPSEELEGYAFTTEVNDRRCLAITTKSQCIPVPAGYFVCREEVEAIDLCSCRSMADPKGQCPGRSQGAEVPGRPVGSNGSLFI